VEEPVTAVFVHSFSHSNIQIFKHSSIQSFNHSLIQSYEGMQAPDEGRGWRPWY